MPLKSDELSNIMSKPFLYDLILLRGLLIGKYFSVNLPDNKNTFVLFSNLDETEINKRLVLWLNKIKKIKINQCILAIISSPNSEHLSFVASSISL